MQPAFDGFRFPPALEGQIGRFRRETDYEAYVAQLIRQVLLTAPGERVNRPDFGAGLRRALFAPSSPETATMIKATVFQALTTWLGTVIDVDEVETGFEDGRLDVTVVYTIKARGDQQVINLEVAQ
jgi:phage baseplate assembly protein W